MYDYNINCVINSYKCVFASSILLVSIAVSSSGHNRDFIFIYIIFLTYMSIKNLFPTNLLIQFFNFCIFLIFRPIGTILSICYLVNS